MSATNPSAPRLHPLTTIRFVAAFIVVLYHTAPRAAGDGVMRSIIETGFTGVGLFFVLSGFILVVVHPTVSGRVAIAQFYIARIARVYPLYVLSLLVDVPRLMVYRVEKYGLEFGAALIGTTLFGQLAMLQVWVPNLSGLNFPSWSVATEAFFYLVFPVALVVVHRLVTIKVRLAALAGAIALSIASGLAATLVAGVVPDAAAGMFGRNPVIRFGEFFTGMILGSLWLSYRGARIAPNVRTLIEALCLAAGLVWYGAVITLAGHIPSGALITACLVPAFALLVFGLASDRGPVALALSLPVFVLFGEASYAVYLLHIPLWVGFEAIGSPSYVFYLIALTIVSIAVHKIFEQPLRRTINRRGESAVRRWESRHLTAAEG